MVGMIDSKMLKRLEPAGVNPEATGASGAITLDIVSAVHIAPIHVDDETQAKMDGISAAWTRQQA